MTGRAPRELSREVGYKAAGLNVCEAARLSVVMRPSATDFEEFFGVTYPRVVRVLGAAWGDPAAAEEATQEAFARILRRWDRVGRMSRPDAYVYTTAANLLRRRVPQPATEVADERTVAGDGDLAERVAVQVSVMAAINRLPFRQRQAVLLRFVADLTVDQVAETMACAPGTVKATLHQASRSLHLELLEDPNGH